MCPLGAGVLPYSRIALDRGERGKDLKTEDPRGEWQQIFLKCRQAVCEFDGKGNLVFIFYFYSINPYFARCPRVDLSFILVLVAI